MICTFFGHSNFTEEIKGKLKNEIIKVIESGFSTFYVATMEGLIAWCNRC